MNIFERAARKKLRFTTNQGKLNTEDLFELTLDQLDAIAADLNGKLTVPGNFSLINPDRVTASQSENQLRFDIVKHIVEDKLARQAAAAAAADARQKRNVLLQALARKQNEAVDQMDIAALQAQLDELDKVAADTTEA